jgi:hypothetical protein
LSSRPDYSVRNWRADIARIAALGQDIEWIANRTFIPASLIAFVSGIEITAVRQEIDVHTLGYFIDTQSQTLQTFLGEQRLRRINRLREIVQRLAGLGVALDADAILQAEVQDAASLALR